MSVDDRQDEGPGLHRASPTGPRIVPPRQEPPPPMPPRPQPSRRANAVFSHGVFRPSVWSVVIFVLLLSGVGIRAYRDLSQPSTWDYWRETYVSASMTATVVPNADIDGSGRGRRALAISGRIGTASTSWFRDQLDKARLSAGDAVLLSSGGGALNQAALMGEIIRKRGLVTAVGTAGPSGQVRPASCASACVLVFAGGKTRYGIHGSMLGVHRFTYSTPIDDPVAEAQRIQGMVLGYMTDMGVSSTIVEAMSQTSDIRWLTPKEALAINLVTTPVNPH
ncbi:hypothetical protein ACFFWD_35040 [Bradyrhizobium erythrophlei]|uniref:COG3904 family protein n=1 Tax=Bradyrhizobium erythrophlei TaxID=1437360 RepID=UPI0035EBC49D